MDKARQQTNRILDSIEREIGRIYKNSPALKRAEAEYFQYMKMVNRETKSEYKAYVKEQDPDTKAKLKAEYTDKVKSLTIESKEYNKIIDQFTDALAETNQQSLDVVNSTMAQIYAVNYNQVAVDCKAVGIEVKDEYE